MGFLFVSKSVYRKFVCDWWIKIASLLQFHCVSFNMWLLFHRGFKAQIFESGCHNLTLKRLVWFFRDRWWTWEWCTKLDQSFSSFSSPFPTMARVDPWGRTGEEGEHTGMLPAEYSHALRNFQHRPSWTLGGYHFFFISCWGILVGLPCT